MTLAQLRNLLHNLTMKQTTARKQLWRFAWWYAGNRHVEWYKTRKEALKRCGEMLRKGYTVEGVTKLVVQ